MIDHVEVSDGLSFGQVFEQHTELVRAAEDAGLWGYHTTEHHLSLLDATPSPSLFLAALAPQTERIQLGSLVHIITGYHPVRLAEEMIMLDHLLGGRLQIGVGKGVSPPEHRILDLETSEIGDVFDDHLDRMVAVLDGQAVDGAPIPFGSVQRPYPPLWYAGNAKRAAELNLNVIVGGGPEMVAKQVATHREVSANRTAAPRYNPTVARTTIGATRHVYIHPDSQTARRRAIESWATYTRHINHHFSRTGEKAPNDPTRGGDANKAMEVGGLVVGSPREVAEAYIELAEVGGPDYLLGTFFWGDLDLVEARGSFDLFVSEVMPAVRAAVDA